MRSEPAIMILFPAGTSMFQIFVEIVGFPAIT
jgi:hypothetical protein